MTADGIRGEEQLTRLIDAMLSAAGDLSLSQTLRRITELATDLVGARYGALGVLEPGRRELAELVTVGLEARVHADIGSLPVGRGILGRMVDEPVPVRLPDLTAHPASAGFPPGHPPMRTFLGVPIRVRAAIFGNLYLTEKLGGGEFTQEDEDVVVALAATAGIAIENARLYGETRRRERWLTAASHVTARLLSGGRDVRSSNLLAVAEAAGVAEADVGFLLLGDHAHAPFEVRAAHATAGTDVSAHLGRSYRLAAEPAAELFGAERPVRTAGGVAAFLPLHGEEPPIPADGGSAVLAPLVARGGVFGVLGVVRHRGRTAFNDGDLHLVHTFSGHAALALEFARLSADSERLTLLETGRA
jgi:GAF domain-containing protein